MRNDNIGVKKPLKKGGELSDVLPVIKLQRFCMHDGPGVRTTVFLKGCPLKCKWCHNPESQSAKNQIFFQSALCVNCGNCVTACDKNAHILTKNAHKIAWENCNGCGNCVTACYNQALEKVSEEVSIDSIVNATLKDVAFYEKLGGVTLSGGEPFIHGNKTIKLLTKLKKAGLNTAVETCGYFNENLIEKAVKVCDVFLFDVKDCNSTRHEVYTGVKNEKIINNLFKIDAFGGKTVLRCKMVNGVNTNEENLNGIISLYKKLKNCTGVEIFSYHHFSEGKYQSLGLNYLGKPNWQLSKAELTKIKKYLVSNGVKCVITG